MWSWPWGVVNVSLRSFYRGRRGRALAGILTLVDPAFSADLGSESLDRAQSVPQPSQWQFSFTPYAWATGVNGSVAARGQRADIDASFIDIVEDSNSLLALMGYFEARKGAFSFFTDVVWEDLGFPGHAKNDFNRQGARRPFASLPNVNVTVDANLATKSHAQLDYESTIIQYRCRVRGRKVV